MNLKTHINTDHPNWKEEFSDSQKPSKLFLNLPIVNWKNFEKGLVKIQDGKESLLSDQEAMAVKSFTKHVYAETENAGADYAEQLLLAKMRKTDSSKYEPLQWSPSTSNICERLFSRAKLTLGYLRHSLTPMHLEACLFLFINKYL